MNADLMSLPAAQVRGRRDCRGGCGGRDVKVPRGRPADGKWRLGPDGKPGTGGMTVTFVVEDL
jgi:hypothetical protein